MRQLGHPGDCHGRRVVSAAAASLASIAAELGDIVGHFVLVLAADTSETSTAELRSSAEALIRRGVSYVCCWGPDCKRLHDVFDEADAVLNGESTDERVLMTTWHDDEPLQEVLWFALNATVPAPAHFADTRSVVAVAVARPDWAEEISDYLEAGAPLPNEA